MFGGNPFPRPKVKPIIEENKSNITLPDIFLKRKLAFSIQQKEHNRSIGDFECKRSPKIPKLITSLLPNSKLKSSNTGYMLLLNKKG